MGQMGYQGAQILQSLYPAHPGELLASDVTLGVPASARLPLLPPWRPPKLSSAGCGQGSAMQHFEGPSVPSDPDGHASSLPLNVCVCVSGETDRVGLDI